MTVSTSEHVRKLLDKLIDIGLFCKTIRIKRGSEGREMQKISWERTALTQEYLDKYGQPDDKLAGKAIQIEKMDVLRQLYVVTKRELIIAKKEHKLLHPLEEPEYLADYYRLFDYCITELRELDIITPHDVNYLQPTFDNNDNFQGMKALSAEQVEQMDKPAKEEEEGL